MTANDAEASTGAPPLSLLERHGPGWPAALEHLSQVPRSLWVLGPLGLEDIAAGVAIVGCREASIAGREIARRLAADLTEAGAVVISGMARGIDSAAHQGALEAGGRTVAVLGSGVDVVFPPRNAALHAAIALAGAVVSEDPPGTEAAPWRFPRRNRIIAALARVVVVVEAGERSGALSTARHAADLGREVMAVPGSIVSPQSVGANRLVRDGAAPVLEAADVLAALPGLVRAGAAPGLESVADAADGGVLRLLGGCPAALDDLVAASGRPAAEVAAEVTALELRGLLRRLPGGLVARLPGPKGPPRGGLGALGRPLL